jgi:hypothetical protein
MPLCPPVNPSQGDTFTFRLEPGGKAALAEASLEDHKQPGELMCSLLAAHLAARRRRAFVEEARRQSLLINAQAQHPASDEAAVMRALGEQLNVDQFGGEWKA